MLTDVRHEYLAVSRGRSASAVFLNCFTGNGTNPPCL